MTTPTTAPGVRRATVEDRDGVIATVIAAFARDPAWAYITGTDFDRVSPHFAAALFDGRVGTGNVWVAGDCDAVAMWDERTAVAPVDADRLWPAYRTAVGESAWESLQAYERALDSARPEPPYWYLGVLAARPDRQGEGLATAVLAPVLARADADGLDCWLETSTSGNRGFYERRGFTESVDVTVPGGPATWWMRRPCHALD